MLTFAHILFVATLSMLPHHSAPPPTPAPAAVVVTAPVLQPPAPLAPTAAVAPAPTTTTTTTAPVGVTCTQQQYVLTIDTVQVNPVTGVLTPVTVTTGGTLAQMQAQAAAALSVNPAVVTTISATPQTFTYSAASC